jgi:hypothetical protein
MYKTQPEKIQRPYEETEGIESDWMTSTVIRRNQLTYSVPVSVMVAPSPTYKGYLSLCPMHGLVDVRRGTWL